MWQAAQMGMEAAARERSDVASGSRLQCVRSQKLRHPLPRRQHQERPPAVPMAGGVRQVRHYYNDHDPFAAQWLRNLIAAGHLPPGDVDERSITDVTPSDVRGYTQCHFFAGVGGWPLALRWAGLEHVAGIWTGSCPCQPLSCAGKRQGHADERHLWPAFYRLIAECAPTVCFGEQVASTDGREWLAGIRADLEDLGYACGAADLCAAGVGAPHIRQRLFWVADAECSERRSHVERRRQATEWDQDASGPGGSGENVPGRLADANGSRREGQQVRIQPRQPRCGGAQVAGAGEARGLGNSSIAGPQRYGAPATESRRRAKARSIAAAGVLGRLEHAQGDGWEPRRAEPVGGSTAARCELDPWADSRAILCSDGVWRRVPVEPVFQPILDGLPDIMVPDFSSVVAATAHEVRLYAKKTNASTGEALRAMWCLAREKTIQQRPRGDDRLLAPQILLLALCQHARDLGEEFIGATSDLTPIQEETLRVLWGVQTTPCSPHQRQLDGSSTRESQNTLCALPPPRRALAQGQSTLHHLRGYVPAAEDVPEALSAMEETWRSLCGDGSQGWDAKRLLDGANVVIASGGHPLAPNARNRASILRGAGNAIIPQVALEFIAAWLEAR